MRSQRINFYQESFRKPVVVLPLKTMLLVTAATFLLLVVVTSFEWGRTQSLQTELASMEASQARLEQAVEKLQQQLDGIVVDVSLQAQEQRLQQGLQTKREFLRRLQAQGDSHEVHFSGYLQGLAAMDNASIWLTRIVLQAPGPQLSLYGITDQPKAIPGYLENLKQESRFLGFAFRVFELARQEDNPRYLTFNVSTQHDETVAN
jgi:hypothetical protein